MLDWNVFDINFPTTWNLTGTILTLIFLFSDKYLDFDDIFILFAKCRIRSLIRIDYNASVSAPVSMLSIAFRDGTIYARSPRYVISDDNDMQRLQLLLLSALMTGRLYSKQPIIQDEQRFQMSLEPYLITDGWTGLHLVQTMVPIYATDYHWTMCSCCESVPMILLCPLISMTSHRYSYTVRRALCQRRPGLLHSEVYIAYFPRSLRYCDSCSIYGVVTSTTRIYAYIEIKVHTTLTIRRRTNNHKTIFVLSSAYIRRYLQTPPNW